EVYLEALAETEVVHREGDRWEWIADSYPANAVSLRSVADGNFVVVDRTGGKQQIIAEVDYSAAALTLYEGAIHMVQSTPYQVERLDWEGRKAFVARTRVDYYTDSIDYTKLKVLDRFEGCAAGRGEAHHGEVHVVRRVAGYKKIRYYTHENIGYGPVNLPDQELHTTAAWWQLPQAVLLRAFASKQDVKAVAVGAHAPCDGVLVGCAQFSPPVYLYDNCPGGVGLGERLWRRQAELVAHARELVGHCVCRAGRPACVVPVLAIDGAK